MKELSQRDKIGDLSLELIAFIQNFLNDFFKDEYEIIRFNSNFLESNGFNYQTKIDYMKLHRFISAAFNTIQSNDVQVIDPLVSKFYKDTIYLNNFYKHFIEKSKDVNAVFKYHFLKLYQGVEGVYKQLYFCTQESMKTTGSLLNEQQLSLFEDDLNSEFERLFQKEFENYSRELSKIINTKMYYFDKLLWYEAKKSLAIREFFKKSRRLDSEGKDELSTKIFIKQYMQTVDLTHAKDVRWHQYLSNVLTMMD